VKGLRLIIVVVQFGEEKISVAAVKGGRRPGEKRKETG
jgi:hypothetical protein